MSQIKQVIVLYNPKSTGNSKRNAHTFKHELYHYAPDIPVRLIATTHPHHSEELGYKYSDPQTLIVSSSGDGGFNELINGILVHPKKQRSPVGLLQSGNANDHYAHAHTGNVYSRIARGLTKPMDVLVANIRQEQRYAHSYIGIGLTSQIGEQLTAASLNPFTEAWIVLRYLLANRSVKIQTSHNHVRRYDSLIFSNVKRMSKVLKLSPKASLTDGAFEVSEVRRKSIFHLIGHLLRAATLGLEHHVRTVNTYRFSTLHPTKIQYDGEVHTLPAHTLVRISVEPRALRTII